MSSCWHKTVPRSLRKLFEECIATDFTVLCEGGGRIDCHVLVLLGAGGLMKERVEQCLDEMNFELDLTHENISVESMREIIASFYCGLTPSALKEENIGDFVQFGTQFDIAWLLDDVLRGISGVLSVANVLKIMAHPHISSVAALTKKCEEYCRDNIEGIISSPGLDVSLLSKDNLSTLLSFQSATSVDQFTLFQCVMKWALRSDENSTSAAHMLGKISLNMISRDKLVNDVYNNLFHQLIIEKAVCISKEDKVAISRIYQNALTQSNDKKEREETAARRVPARWLSDQSVGSESLPMCETPERRVSRARSQDSCLSSERGSDRVFNTLSGERSGFSTPAPSTEIGFNRTPSRQAESGSETGFSTPNHQRGSSGRAFSTPTTHRVDRGFMTPSPHVERERGFMTPSGNMSCNESGFSTSSGEIGFSEVGFNSRSRGNERGVHYSSILSHCLSRSWQNMDYREVKQIVTSDSLPDSEFVVVEGIMLWIANDVHRKQYAEDLLRDVRFSSLCPVYVRSVLTTFVTEKLLGSVRLCNNICRTPSVPRVSTQTGRVAGWCDNLPLGVQRLTLGDHTITVKCQCGNRCSDVLHVSRTLPTVTVKSFTCSNCGPQTVQHAACTATLTPDVFPSLHLLPFNHLSQFLSSMEDLRIYLFK